MKAGHCFAHGLTTLETRRLRGDQVQTVLYCRKRLTTECYIVENDLRLSADIKISEKRGIII